jgi:hypothetical protein
MTSTENLQTHRIATHRSWPQDPATFWNAEELLNILSGGICNRETQEAVREARSAARHTAWLAAHNARPASERSGWTPPTRRTQACHSRVNRMTGEVEFD